MRTTIALSKKKGHIIITVSTFDADGFASETKTAAVPIDPEKDPEDMLEKARQKTWEIHGEPDSSGFYKARIAA